MKKKLGISILSYLLLFSCSSKKNDGSSDQYPSNEGENRSPSQTFLEAEELTLYKKNVSENIFYIAKNLGGLGIETIEDKLDLYPGIPFQGNLDYDNNVVIENYKNSDEECKKIFYYEKINSQVKINYPEFVKPLECIIKIKIQGNSSKINNSDLHLEKKIKIRLNMTMKSYMKNNDPEYLKFSGYQQSIYSRLNEIVNEIKTNKNIVVNNLKLDNLNFLEGAKEYVTSLEIKNSTINNYYLIKEFKYLKSVSLDGFNLSDSKLKEILNMLPKLEKLSIRNNNLTNIDAITDLQPDLVELDISGNPVNIDSLSELSKLKKLKKVVLRNLNLTTLKSIQNVIQIIDLDISENPLRKFSDFDVDFLKSLINLEALNVSVDRDNVNSSPITDKVLNEYFRSLVKDSSPQKLKKFIARNRWEKNSKNCSMINNFEQNIDAINLLNNIEYLDLHGNGCVDLSWGIGKYSGLTSLPLMNYRNLKYLNISDTPIRSFRGTINWMDNNITFILNETPWDLKTGIFMSKDECLLFFPEGNRNRFQCNGLTN